jgi:hypothetical protein
MDGAVQVDYVVVAYLLEALLAVPAVQVFYCVVAAGGGGAAVDYDFCYLSHTIGFYCRVDILVFN